MIPEKLVLFDWDNTIATGVGKLKVSELRSAIRSKIDQGWHIGLNSDTPLKRLKSWWNLLDMNGPIVAEKGAVIWLPGGQEIFVSRTPNLFKRIRNNLISILTHQPEVSFFIGDNTRFIRSVDNLESDDYIITALDAYRSCSVGLFVRKIINRKLSVDVVALEQIYQLVREIVPTNERISPVSINIEHGFISVNSLDSDKTKGVQELLSRWGKDANVVMVGDSTADYLPLPRIKNCAVGNAQIGLKEKSELVARGCYSDGCIEILSLI